VRATCTCRTDIRALGHLFAAQPGGSPTCHRKTERRGIKFRAPILVTGATGFIGSAVVKELLSSGHQVTGLTTTPDGAQRLQKWGAKARLGKLSQHALLREAAAESDGVIHTAFIHGLSHMSLTTRLRLFAGALNGGIRRAPAAATRAWAILPFPQAERGNC